MPDEIIDLGDSPPTPPDADLWLEYGRKLVNDADCSTVAVAVLSCHRWQMTGKLHYAVSICRRVRWHSELIHDPMESGK